MGLKPSPEHTLDRLDNSKDYGPGNCRWATRKEQMENRTSTLEKMWLANIGRKQSPEHIEKRRLASIGRVASKKARKNMSEAAKRRCKRERLIKLKES
jgi:hypothetical protein